MVCDACLGQIKVNMVPAVLMDQPTEGPRRATMFKRHGCRPEDKALQGWNCAPEIVVQGQNLLFEQIASPVHPSNQMTSRRIPLHVFTSKALAIITSIAQPSSSPFDENLKRHGSGNRGSPEVLYPDQHRHIQPFPQDTHQMSRTSFVIYTTILMSMAA